VAQEADKWTAAANNEHDGCQMMFGDYSRGYLVPRGYCRQPWTMLVDGKRYCEEHGLRIISEKLLVK